MQRYWINKKKVYGRFRSFQVSNSLSFEEVLILDAMFLSFDSLDFLVFFFINIEGFSEA